MSGAMAGAAGGMPGGLPGGDPGEAQTAGEEAAERAATAAGAAAMAALGGLAGAFAGAALARSRREGMGRAFPWRLAIERTDRQGDRRLAEGQYGRAERSYPRPEDEVREVSRQEGPGAPSDPYHH
jgi:hypothetical protein